jgi:hypothetical protein
MPPPSPEDVAVDAGGTRIQRDKARMNGWDYGGPDNMSIVLHGAPCDKVKSGAYKDVKITYGCPGMIIP